MYRTISSPRPNLAHWVEVNNDVCSVGSKVRCLILIYLPDQTFPLLILLALPVKNTEILITKAREKRIP